MLIIICRKRGFYLSLKKKKEKKWKGISQETADKLLNFIVKIKIAGKCLGKKPKDLTCKNI